MKRILRVMLRDGDIVQTRKCLYVLPEDTNLLTGYF